jgi:hypothetical protein
MTVLPLLHAKLPLVLGVIENAACVLVVFIALLKFRLMSVAGEMAA